jgi:hypothetical protein
MDRFTQSVDAAQAALQDLRDELSKGSRDVLTDLDTTLRDARKNLRSISKTITTDLGNIQHALATGKPAPTRAADPGETVAPAPARRRTRTETHTKTAPKATTAEGSSAGPAEPISVPNEPTHSPATSAEQEAGSPPEP